MRYTIIFLLFTTLTFAEPDIRRVFEYFFSHPDECGDLFANDAVWIPAHEECTINCDITTTVCMKAVKGKKQKCDTLPEACVKGLKSSLEKPAKTSTTSTSKSTTAYRAGKKRSKGTHKDGGRGRTTAKGRTKHKPSAKKDH